MRRLLALFVLVVATFAIGSAPARAAGPNPALEWRGCGSGFQCSSLSVPIDYSNASSGSIDLALIRLPAASPSQRIGSLLVNPGGPGGSAIDFLRAWSGSVSPDIRARFDLFAFDPRGVGESNGIVCHDTLQQLFAVNPNPASASDWQKAEAAARVFVDACAQKYRDVLPYLGTKNVARDMESVRKALGEDRLTYLGYSYGTAIGQVYADMYPDRVRAFVLDGAIDLSLDFEQINQQQMVGFERAYRAYVDDCKRRACSLAGNGDPAAAIDQLIARAEQQPIPAAGSDRDAGAGEALTAIFSALYSQQQWPRLTRALQNAIDGNGSGLIALTDQYLERNPDGSYPDITEANMAVNYVDEVCPKDPAAYPAMADRFAKAAPHFGPSAAVASLTCAFWPATADPAPAPKAHGAPAILVVDTTNDPATPWEWGVAVSKQLESGHLLTHRGNGHTIYAQGNSCIDAAVNAYLIELIVPPDGQSCGNGPPPPTTQPGDIAASPSPTPAPPATGTTRADANRSVLIAIAAAMLLALVCATLVMIARRRV